MVSSAPVDIRVWELRWWQLRSTSRGAKPLLIGLENMSCRGQADVLTTSMHPAFNMGWWWWGGGGCKKSPVSSDCISYQQGSEQRSLHHCVAAFPAFYEESRVFVTALWQQGATEVVWAEQIRFQGQGRPFVLPLQSREGSIQPGREAGPQNTGAFPGAQLSNADGRTHLCLSTILGKNSKE